LAMLLPRRCLLGRLFWCGALCTFGAEAKMVMGIANSQDYHVVSTFCFVFPQPASPGAQVPNGRIHSQTIVSSSGHKFLVLNNSDLQAGLACDELVRRARVIEPLSEKTKEVIAYDLTLKVEPSMADQHIAAVIARCGQPVKAEYIVEFTNPGDSFERHFACSDQGIFRSYIWLSLLALAEAPAFCAAQKVLQRRQVHNDVSAMFFAGAAFFTARVWLFTLHVFVYSRNGMGLSMLLFVAQFLDFLSNTMAALVLVALVHGVYITRPNVPTGSEERTLLIRVVGTFAATYLFSTLMSGFSVDGLLTPVGVVEGSASWPYLITRSCMGPYCFSRGVKLAAEVDAQPKKQHILRFSLLALAWLSGPPVLMAFVGQDGWDHVAPLADAATMAMLGVLLWDFWPSRFGTLFSCVKATARAHPYCEFGLEA